MVSLPITAYLITHPSGNVLFDTGPHVELTHPGSDRPHADPPSTRLGSLSKYMTLSFKPDEHIVPRLAALGLSASDVTAIVNSHLHYDHAGGNTAFPDAKVYVQRAEWEAAHQADLIVRNATTPTTTRSPVPRTSCASMVSSTCTATGPSCCCPPTGTRRAINASWCASAAGAIILSGDACYLHENLERGMVSRLSFNVAQADRVAGAPRGADPRGAEIIIGHDPDQWRRIPQAPRDRLDANRTSASQPGRPSLPFGSHAMSEHLKFEVSGGIATLTLNRPEKLNAFTYDNAGRLGRSAGGVPRARRRPRRGHYRRRPRLSAPAPTWTRSRRLRPPALPASRPRST